MAEEKEKFYIILGKKNPMNEAKSKLVKYFLQNKKQVNESSIFEFIDEEINLENAENLIQECKSVLGEIIIILLPINTRTGSDDKTTKDETFKEKIKKNPGFQYSYFYNEFLTASNSE